MASAIAPARVRVLMHTSTGKDFEMFNGHTNMFGACPNGVPTNSYEKWPVAVIKREVTRGGELRVEVTADAAKTLDASDAMWNIPVYVHGSGVKNLNNNSTDFDKLALADIALVASTPTIVARASFPSDVNWSFGGGSIYLTLQDNTA